MYGVIRPILDFEKCGIYVRYKVSWGLYWTFNAMRFIYEVYGVMGPILDFERVWDLSYSTSSLGKFGGFMGFNCKPNKTCGFLLHNCSTLICYAHTLHRSDLESWFVLGLNLPFGKKKLAISVNSFHTYFTTYFHFILASINPPYVLFGS